MYTVDHTFGYRSKKFICACMDSSTHAHDTKSEAGIFKNNSGTRKEMGNFAQC